MRFQGPKQPHALPCPAVFLNIGRRFPLYAAVGMSLLKNTDDHLHELFAIGEGGGGKEDGREREGAGSWELRTQS